MATELMGSDDEYITRNQLIEKLSEIRSHAHYIYALWNGLPKEMFYIQRLFDTAAGTVVEDDKDNSFTLEEFLEKADTMLPEDSFYMHLILLKREEEIVEGEDVEHCCSDYAVDDDFLPEKLVRDVCEFLDCYCERRLRENSPFSLNADTIRHFNFTGDDMKILMPIVDRCNRKAKIKIRKEYDNLACLDFIINNENV